MQHGSDDGRARRRLRGLAVHFAVFFVVSAVLALVNFLMFPDRIFVIFPVVLWGAPLAIHAAYAMGLFDAFGKGNR